MTAGGHGVIVFIVVNTAQSQSSLRCVLVSRVTEGQTLAPQDANMKLEVQHPTYRLD